MFYDRFSRLCREKETTPTAVCLALGYSNSLSTYWKKSGRTPKREALEKIAAHLGVSVDYLLDREEKIAPVVTDRSDLSEVLMQLTIDELVEVLDFARYLLSKRQSQEPPTVR
jgi:transcriptional regulator with XRE-family HTH domain